MGEDGKASVFKKGKQQEVWPAIIVIKAVPIKGVTHRAAATFLCRWWSRFRAAAAAAADTPGLHFQTEEVWMLAV